MSDDKMYFDIDELAKKIEMRIKELEKDNVEKNSNVEYVSKKTKAHIFELDEIIKEIDNRIIEIEEQEAKDKIINIDDLTNKVNKKLEKLDDIKEEDIGKTIDDLSSISDSINEIMKNLEIKRKKRKQQKARYCDLARKKANTIRNKKIK